MSIIRGLMVLTLLFGTIHTAALRPEAGLYSFLGAVVQSGAVSFDGEFPVVNKLMTGGSGLGPQSLEISTRGAPFMGSEAAKVTMVEFSDYQCFFCRRHDRQVAPRIVKEYVQSGKVKYVFRDFPLASHPGAAKAAQAAHCAGDQGKYWDMNDLLFRHQQTLTTKNLAAFGGSLGLDKDLFLGCVESGKYAKKVQAGQREGNRIGVRGTPSFFFGLTDVKQPKIKVRNSLTGAHPYPAFKRAIEDLLAQ